MVEIEPGRAPAAPKDAATVLILRPEPRGFSVYMVRRHSKSAFMGGAYVFPGGKLDPEDSLPSIIARTIGRDAASASRALGEDDGREDDRGEGGARSLGLFVAALRETFEEAGLLLTTGSLDAATVAAARATLTDRSFAEVVATLDVNLDLTQLTPWTRWVTPVVEPRRYDTRFFLARAPVGQIAEHDRHETTQSEWLTPADALSREQRGEIQLPPPTMRSLEMLAAYDDVDGALAAAVEQVPPLIEPVFSDEGGRFALLLPGDPGHPIDETRIPGATRFVLADGRWWSGEPQAAK